MTYFQSFKKIQKSTFCRKNTKAIGLAEKEVDVVRIIQAVQRVDFLCDFLFTKKQRRLLPYIRQKVIVDWEPPNY